MRNHTRRSTKIGDVVCGVSSDSPFGRNDKIVRIRAVCHFEEREILASSSTKIGDLICGVSCVVSPFGRNDKKADEIISLLKMKIKEFKSFIKTSYQFNFFISSPFLQFFFSCDCFLYPSEFFVIN